MRLLRSCRLAPPSADEIPSATKKNAVPVPGLELARRVRPEEAASRERCGHNKTGMCSGVNRLFHHRLAPFASALCLLYVLLPLGASAAYSSLLTRHLSLEPQLPAATCRLPLSEQQAPIALPPDLAALMQQAEDDLQRNDYQGALAPLKKITAAAPETAAAWYYLGYAQHGLHQDGDARQAYEKAVTLNPDLAEAQVNLGALLVAAHEFAAALPHLQAAVKLKPNDPHAHLSLALALDGADRRDAALQEFQRTTELDPGSEIALYEAGHIELSEKHFTEAAADLAKAAALRPDDAAAKRDLAAVDEAQGQFAGAGQQLDAYLKLRPGDTMARVHLAHIYLDQHQTDLALAQLQQIDPSEPLPPDVEASLADDYALAGKLSDAETHYRKALQSLGDQADLHRALAETLLKEKKNAEAEAEFRRTLAIDPQNTAALKGLGTSIYLEERYADAAPIVERLLQLPGASPGLYFILATCYDHVRDRPRALAAYKQYLARADGSNPDQEWQAEQRAKLLSREIAKGI